jgi:hypothetical protein
LSRDLGIPSEHGLADPLAELGAGTVFTRELRVRFLDHLAFHGNARAAAARVGVSHETVYRARRRDDGFAALWDAALVHARRYGEQVLATRALDGTEVDIWHRGELVGHDVRHDPRLLLAHLARLDRHVEADPGAVARARRFDELLARYAGHPVPDYFDEAVDEARGGWSDPAAPRDLPPTRAEYLAYHRGLAMDLLDAEQGVDPEASLAAEADLAEALCAQAARVWDAWHKAALARVGAIVEPEPDETEEEEEEGAAAPPADAADPASSAGLSADAGPQDDGISEPGLASGCAPDGLPYEIKSMPARHRVTPVNPAAGRRGQTRPGTRPSSAETTPESSPESAPESTKVETAAAIAHSAPVTQGDQRGRKRDDEHVPETLASESRDGRHRRSCACRSGRRAVRRAAAGAEYRGAADGQSHGLGRGSGSGEWGG